MAKTWGTATELQANWKFGYDFRVKTMTLCEECNSKWLGPFEEKAKPKLIGWMTRLRGLVTDAEKRLLAFWAIKTAMTVDLAYPGGKRHIPPNQYRELHRIGDKPPEGVHIWAALRVIPYRGIGHKSRDFRFQYFDRSEVVPRPKLQDGYQIVYSIRHLEVHIFGLGVGGVNPLEILPREVAPLVSADSPFHRLWPINDVPVISG